jgi:hypothetical protein
MRILIIIIFILAALISMLVYGQSNITYDPGTLIEIQSGADVCADAIVINGTYTGSGTICTGPLPVTISSFTYSVSKNNITLLWTTESELNNSGFDLEKKETKGESSWKKITFVQGSGTTQEHKSYFYEDKNLKTGSYNYRIKQIDFNGNYEYFELQDVIKINPPAAFSMSQNYPNPFNPLTSINYEIPLSGIVKIVLYNLLGQEMASLVNEYKEAGYYTALFNGSNYASGVYIYRISANNFTNTKKMLLIK